MTILFSSKAKSHWGPSEMTRSWSTNPDREFSAGLATIEARTAKAVNTTSFPWKNRIILSAENLRNRREAVKASLKVMRFKSFRRGGGKRLTQIQQTNSPEFLRKREAHEGEVEVLKVREVNIRRILWSISM